MAQHIDPERLKKDIEALGKLSVDDLKKGGATKRHSFLEAIGQSFLEFLGVDAEKAGRKLSRARLQKLQGLQGKVKEVGDELTALLKDADGGDGFLDALRDKGDIDMKPEEIKAAVTEAIKPLQTGLDELKTRVGTVEADVKKAAKPDADDKDKPDAAAAEALKGVVADALKPIQTGLDELKTRVQGVEDLAKKSRQPDPDPDKDKKPDKDPFGTAVREKRAALVTSYRDRAAARNPGQ